VCGIKKVVREEEEEGEGLMSMGEENE